MMIYLHLFLFLLVCMNAPCITTGNLTKGLNTETKTKDIAKAIVKTGAKYEVTYKLCDSYLGQNTIQTEAQCRHAASQLGRRFIRTVNLEERKPGCYAIRHRVYFNTNPNPGATGSRPTAASICSKAKYEVTYKLCDSNLGQNTIQTEAQCRHAASQLGRIFLSTTNSERWQPGCIAIRRRVYFNTNSSPGTTGSRSAASICSKGTCRCGVKGGQRIVGGEDVNPGEWPWIVLLVSGGTDGSKQWLNAFCGGTLVASQWILTAAHCFHDKYNWQNIFANTMSAVIGEHNIWTTNDRNDTKRKNLEIEKIEIHPDFNLRTENDIALLKLKPVDLSDYMKACLLPGDKDWSGKTAWVYGWGAISNNGRRHKLLREAELNIISNDDCKGMSGWYNGKNYNMSDITDDMMCADMPGKDACDGDSGGPLTVEMNNKHYLAGIVSWGYGCATEGLPGVFADVSHLREWIEETVNDNGGADFCSGLD